MTAPRWRLRYYGAAFSLGSEVTPAALARAVSRARAQVPSWQTHKPAFGSNRRARIPQVQELELKWLELMAAL